ncbi:hypothetical protein [uncultured Propionibacterium sp.]|uniref:hypothetical protein n=1 Tax=uncultured Propionibacterium sp. TaxID=218066 RepID=UPI00292F611B|nr:hypothetical protein [uncultured Propionibacterium sp.]
MGTKEKEWVRDADAHPWLFKEARAKRGYVRGEDWAECLVHALAGLIGVPSACVCPAIRDGRRGVLSRSVLSGDERLEHGNELLTAANPKYDKTNARNLGYTVSAVNTALAPVEAPPCMPLCMTGFETWSGYLMLDAWVSGCDRHHENWAAIRTVHTMRLAPSFDHGNALGFQVPERQLNSLASSDNIERWSKKGVNRYFRGKPGPVTLAAEALNLCAPRAAKYWLGRLEDVSEDHVQEMLQAPPDRILSEPRRNFIEKLLRTNRRRILDAIGPCAGRARPS